jgi:CheY-like chemotaxis protein
VLVVDDEEELRRSVRRFLEKVGYDVSEAWSGRSAIAQITAGHPPEVMVTDLRMSDGSGSWLLHQISQDFPELLKRTIILTGDPDEPSIANVVRSTGCSVLSKPVDFPDLLEALDQVADL